MKFEELQVIWNTQNQRPLYAIDETVVQAELWGHRQALRRTWFRWNIAPAYLAAGLLGVLIAGNLLLAGALSTSAAITLRVAALSVAAAVMLGYFVATVVRDQQQERRRAAASTGSLREELERSIARLEYEIRAGGGGSAGKKAIPLFVAVSLAMWAVADVTGASLWLPASVGPMMLLGLPIELWRHRCRVTRDLLPRKRTLESLRARLTSPP